MIITKCPRCGAMNTTTTCTKCGWSQFAQVTTVSTRITGEIEIMLSGKALLVDYKRLLFENRNLTDRIAELEEQVWNLNLENERLEEAYWIDETISPDGTLKPSVRKLLERLEKAETDLRLSDDLVKALDNRIAELEEKQRWISVSERLPDTKIVYDKFDVIVELVDIVNGEMIRHVDMLSYDYRNKSWNDDCGEFGFYPVTGVTHWRERPTPPEVQE